MLSNIKKIKTSVSIDPFLAIIAIIGLAFAYYRFGWSVLNPKNISWLLTGGDTAQHFLGWHFFRSEKWQLPPGLFLNYIYPLGTSIGYTDSIPLIALPLKLFSFVLPKHFQYFGIWIYINHILQAIFGYLLVSVYSNKRIINFLFGLFFLFSPIMIFREPHIALSSHWLIIAALWNYFVIDITKNFMRYKIYWVILIGVAGLVHPYLGIMVLAISIASILREWLIKSNLNSISAISQIGLFTVLLIAEWWTTGFFSIKILDKGERGFGFFSMNINGLINSFGTSRWIPGLPSYKNGQYEGYAYIGLGLFFLIIISAILYIHELIINRSRTFSKIIDNIPLIILCLGFMLISLSNIVTLGDKVVLSIKLGDGVLKSFFEVFRSSGRFFWPVYYLIFFLVAWIITKRLRIRYALPLIAIGLILQICEQKMIQYDLYKNRTYIGNLTDHRWIDVIKPFNTIIVIPPYEYSLKNRDDFIDFSFLASDNYKRITTGYTARFSADDLKICTEKIIKQIHKRKFKYNQLYVFSELSIVDYLLDIKNLLRCHRLNEYIACYSKKHNAIIPEEIDLDTYQLKFASQKLDQYIKDNIGKIIIIVARDEASLGLPIIVKDYLATIGSKIYLLGYRDSYAVIIKNGEIFYEEINSYSAINYIWPEGTLLQSAKGNNLIINKSLEVYSAGFLVGNNAYIRLSGESIATNQRGLNIVVLDDQFNLLSRASCDTFVYDVALVEIIQ